MHVFKSLDSLCKRFHFEVDIRFVSIFLPGVCKQIEIQNGLLSETVLYYEYMAKLRVKVGHPQPRSIKNRSVQTIVQFFLLDFE